MHTHDVLSAEDALGDVFDGAMVCVGGFGPVRNRPIDLLMALADQANARNLTIVSNGFPHQPLAENHQVKKFVGAFGGSVYRRAAASEEQIRSGELEFEPSPQGIFTERLRAGAGGIAAFYSPVGAHTVVANNKERRTIDGRDYILETALRPDFGLIRAEKADELGNLTGIGSTLNFHPSMAAASKITIAEVDEIVPAGTIAPEDVKIPGIYVDRLVLHDTSRDQQSDDEERQRRQRRVIANTKDFGLTQDQMAMRAALLLAPGQYVNLGMGIPTKVANYITAESGVMLHAENGILGYGPQPTEDEFQWQYFNAQGRPGHGAAGRRGVRQLRRLHYGAGRAPRRGDPRRTAGFRQRRPRQLVGAAYGRGRHGRRDGPVHQRARAHRHHGPCHARRRQEAAQRMQLSIDRAAVRHEDHHGSRLYRGRGREADPA